MGSIFSYDSKFMQTLMYIGDLIILNLLFMVCCVPLFTIGAAQTGLHSAMKVLLDKEDDTSPAKAFFRGFRNGFGRITLVWLVFFVIFALLSVSLVPILVFDTAAESSSPVVISVIAMAACAVFYNLVVQFHTRFTCTVGQLLRNSMLMFIAHPIRSILSAAVIWAPLILMAVDLYVFMEITPIILAAGFSIVFMFGYMLMNKPFLGLIRDRQEAEKAAEEAVEEIPEETGV